MRKTISFVALAFVIGGCSSQNQNLNDPAHVICADQASYVQQIPTGPFSDPAQAALALKTFCGIFAPSPAASPTPGK